MPFGRVPSNIVLDVGPGPPREGERFMGSKPFMDFEIFRPKTLYNGDVQLFIYTFIPLTIIVAGKKLYS